MPHTNRPLTKHPLLSPDELWAAVSVIARDTPDFVLEHIGHDLRVHATPEILDLVKRYRFRKSVSYYQTTVHGRAVTWCSIPFGYKPYFDERNA